MAGHAKPFRRFALPRWLSSNGLAGRWRASLDNRDDDAIDCRTSSGQSASHPMTDFTPLQSLIGGALIGLSAVLLMALHGRIAGMTGILSGVVPRSRRTGSGARRSWRVRSSRRCCSCSPAARSRSAFRSRPARWSSAACSSASASHFGNGCPSGHGICGIARLSPRSLVAVPTFMATAFITVYVIRHVIAG